MKDQIAALWNNQSQLGQVILSVADTIELDAFIATCTLKRIKKIKSAAKAAWKPNPASNAQYRGEKCELIEFGSNMRYWKVCPVSGTAHIKVSVNEVDPWLGF